MRWPTPACVAISASGTIPSRSRRCHRGSGLVRCQSGQRADNEHDDDHARGQPQGESDRRAAENPHPARMANPMMTAVPYRATNRGTGPNRRSVRSSRSATDCSPRWPQWRSNRPTRPGPASHSQTIATTPTTRSAWIARTRYSNHGGTDQGGPSVPWSEPIPRASRTSATRGSHVARLSTNRTYDWICGRFSYGHHGHLERDGRDFTGDGEPAVLALTRNVSN
jgi:hypothetical protein